MWTYPKIIAHRGGGTLAPENTLAGIRCGLAHGFYAVEFDVMLSADEVPVLMHDPRGGRTVPGRRCVSDCTAAELAAMDAGSWFGSQFAGEPPPSYLQVLEFCTQHKIWMNVEIKPVPGFESRTGTVVAAETLRFLASQPSAVMPLFSSFAMDALLAAKAEAPHIPRGYLMDRIASDWQTLLQETGAVSLHVNHRHLSPRQTTAIHDAGYGVFCYTVNDPIRAEEILSWGVDAFCTDRIDLIRFRSS
ncbi:MAG: glycerophosphodiester phosphodiesterase [Herminiimonas sp.]|nr:glycerophosphodiester phosphodiesterase [Herminiimonas sp.]